MPSRSRAMSMISRFLAACAISMSDFGLACCEAPIGAFMGGLRLVLLDARRLAGLHQVDGLEHRVDAHREQAVEIDRAERVGAGDRRLLLNENVAGIEPVVGPEDRQPGLRLALDDRPI